MHGSLFSGIGGFDLAAEWMGWGNAFHCEWDDFGTKVLNYYWPNAKSYGDITKTDFMEWRGRIYILTGGFPCQPFSMAGKRKGKDDDRYLWPEMLRAIREIQPTWVIGENVGGIISMVQPCDEVEVGGQASLLEEDYFTQKDQEYIVETVCSDLEREGYSVQPFLIPACAIGAPHRRDRVWFVAKNTKCDGLLQREPEQERAKNGQLGNIGAGGGNGIYKQEDGGATADTSITGREEWQQNRGRQDAEKVRAGMDNRPERHGNIRVIADTKSTGTGQDIRGLRSVSDRHSEGIQDATPYTRLLRPQGAGEQTAGVEQCDEGDVADTSNQGLERSEIGRGIRSEWEKSHKQPSRFIRPDWQNFPTVSPLCDRNDGLSDRLSGITFSKWRNESIKAMGNAIVPQVVYQIFKAIEQYERLNP